MSDDTEAEPTFLDRVRSRALSLRRDAFSSLSQLGFAGFGSGWVNQSSGQGVAGRDKMMSLDWAGRTPLPEVLLESLFTFNDLAYVITTALPDWGLRHGWDVTLRAPDADELGRQTAVALISQEISSEVKSDADRLKLHESQLFAATWGQLYGGGLMLLGLNDGGTSADELNLDKLESIDWVRVVPRRDTFIVHRQTDPSREGYGLPLWYDVLEYYAGVPAQPTRWHASRVIVYPGAITPPRYRALNKGWDLSILDRVINKLAMHDGLWDSVAAMAADGSQGVWKIKGLMNAVLRGKDGVQKVQDRFRLADEAKSIFRSLLLDSDGEDFQYVHRQFSGIDGLLAQSAIRTAAAAQMPVTVLYGQSPAGLNATGESDIRLWYDRIESYQEDVLRPRLERLVHLIFRSKSGPTKGIEPSGWRVTFRPVRKETPMEAGELRARQAQVDSAYISAGVLRPEEVAISRFTPEGWSAETHIELVQRAEQLFAAEQSGEPIVPPRLLVDPRGPTTQPIVPPTTQTQANPHGARVVEPTSDPNPEVGPPGRPAP